MALLTVGANPRCWPAAILENFEMAYPCNGHPVHFVFGSRVKVYEKIMREE